MSRVAVDVDVSLRDLLAPDPVPASEPATRERSRLRRAIRFVNGVLAAFVVTLFTAFLVGLTIPPLFGYHNLTVMSGSMEPAIHTGDVVIDQPVSPLDVRIGDIVTFRDPADHSKLITHRVRHIEVRGDTVYVQTKGDATNSVQKWSIPANGRVGRVILHLWKLGYLMFWVSRPWGRIVLVVIPVLLLGIWEIRRIWRHEPERETGEAA